MFTKVKTRKLAMMILSASVSQVILVHIGLHGFPLTNWSNFKVKTVSLANGLRICFPPLLHFKIQLVHCPNKLTLRRMVSRLEGYSKDDILSLVIDITGQLVHM